MKKNIDLCLLNFRQIPKCELFLCGHSWQSYKLRLNEPINNKIVYPFRDKQELFNLFKKFEWSIDGLELEEEVNGGMYLQLIKFVKGRLISVCNFTISKTTRCLINSFPSLKLFSARKSFSPARFKVFV